MYNLAIIKCTSPPLLAPMLKIFKINLLPRRGLNPGPAEPEADMLPQCITCYETLSERSMKPSLLIVM